MTEWKKLQRASEPLTSTVSLDPITEELFRPFDYESDGTEKFYPYLLPEVLPKSWNIGVIVGASGTGKSQLLTQFDGQL